MIKKQVIIVFIIALLLVHKSAVCQYTQEQLVNQTIKCIATGNFDTLHNQCFFTKKFMLYVIRIKDSTATPAMVDSMYRKEYLKERKRFSALLDSINVNKIDLKKSKIKVINSEIKRIPVSEIFNIEKCDIKVEIEYKKNTYILILDDCLYSAEDGWRIGDRIKWRGKNDFNDE